MTKRQKTEKAPKKEPKMKFEKLDINKHNLDKVSKWIYESELEVFRPLLGKNVIEALKNIKMLIKSKNNMFSHQNIYVATDVNGNILGILVAFTGNDKSFFDDLKIYYNALGLIASLEYIIKGSVIDRWLISNMGKNDYYLCNIAVDPGFRGRGIGTFILENSFQIAKEKGCKRVLLDVSFENDGAKRLYERFGFKVYCKNSSRWIWKDKGTYGMEYTL